MNIRQSAIDRAKAFEGLVAHFYLDTVGAVTIGHGHMTPSAAAAAALALKKNGAAAADLDKRNDWTTISTKEKGKLAAFYGPFTTVRLDAAAAEALLKADLSRAAGDLVVRFAKLDNYPEPAQDALLDMIFNIGLTNFNNTKWKQLFAAVEAQDWTKAAKECNRLQVPQSRNDQTKALFEAAATLPAQLNAPNLLLRRVSTRSRKPKAPKLAQTDMV